MALFQIENLNFTYPIQEVQALKEINAEIEEGDFLLICGESASGKSTLLKLLKHDIAPHGQVSGQISYKNKAITDYTEAERATEIGFVFQSPDDQIVMPSVLDELVFGMENLQYPRKKIHNKLAEVSQFFGIADLLEREVQYLSGGQKQLVNLAAVLALDPQVILLDEPTAQLDPISAKNFLQHLKQINDELGISIIIVEHRLDDVLPLATKMIALEKGEMLYYGPLRQGLSQIDADSPLYRYLPKVSQFYLKEHQIPGPLPITVKEARDWLKHDKPSLKVKQAEEKQEKLVLELKNLDFQYDIAEPRIINNLSGSFDQATSYALLGENGSGKSTLLKILAGIYSPQHGKVKEKEENLKLAYVPQNPLHFFLYDKIGEEYQQLLEKNLNSQEKYEDLLSQFKLEKLLDKHPYDLSGGELQKAAILGALLLKPDILILDEPSKGLDPLAKEGLGYLLDSLMKEGLTIILASHDLEFVAEHINKVYFMFQGSFTSHDSQTSQDFFKENQYYTTSLKKLSRSILPEEIVSLKEIDS